MSFLDKLTGKKEEEDLPIPPPPVPPGQPGELPPMPGPSDAQQPPEQLPDAPIHQDKLPEMQPPEPPASHEAMDAPVPPVMSAPMDIPAPEPVAPEIPIPELNAEPPALTSESVVPSSEPEMPGIEPMAPAMPPPPQDTSVLPDDENPLTAATPAPAEPAMVSMDIPDAMPPTTTRDDVRKAFSDVPPITVKEEAPKEAPSDAFDVDKLVIPSRDAEPSVPAAPQPPAQDESPLQPLQVAPSQMQPEIGSVMPQSTGMRPQGPLFISLHKYDRVQRSVAQLRKELVKLTADVKTIEQLKEKEDKEFGNIVAKLQQVQDELLSIDGDLFEQ